MTYTSHGHHIAGTILDEEPKKVARCGGPGICNLCSIESTNHMMQVITNTPKTYWNGLETPAFRGSAVVADNDRFPSYWAREEGLVGARIPVVMVILDGVNMGGGISFIDNRDGSGWKKVTDGKGMPNSGHRDVTIVEHSFILSG